MPCPLTTWCNWSFDGWLRSTWYLQFIPKRSFYYCSKSWKFVNDNRQSIKQLISFLNFHIRHYLNIFLRFVKSLTSYLLYIVVRRQEWLLNSHKFLSLCLYVLHKSCLFHIGCLVLFLQGLWFSSCFHEGARIIVVIFLQFLKLSSLFK